MSITAERINTAAIRIPIGGGIELNADIGAPPEARALVLFAHGSGSSRLSPRNRYVASELNFLNLATILADLFTEEEGRYDQRSGALRFNIALLTDRLVRLTDWARSYSRLGALPIGLFGASTGAAAALDAAAARPEIVGAVVSRGGRPDLATRLREVYAPTLLIVGGNDAAVLDMNSKAALQLTCTKHLEVIPNATHLFEEPGALEAVATSAGSWFQQHLTASRAVA